MATIETITEILQLEFKKLHAKFRTVKIIRLKDLQVELNTWRNDGVIPKKFFEQNYGQFLFYPPDTVQNARSIVIIGILQKIICVEFFYKGKPYQVVIPPTYVYSDVRATCQGILSNVLRKNGFSVDRAILPMKLLAVRSGLGKYGKNNLCYVDGMGSFTRLEGFYTNYEFPKDDWCEKEIMVQCKNCSLCQKACPTQCIPDDRILIHADHCLTYFNENEGNFPTWVTRQSHNALVGCLYCQIVCPQNKKYLKFYQNKINFTEEEILFILRKTPKEHIPQTLAKKLIDLDLDEYYSLLERNLSVLIQSNDSPPLF
ncbi:hypothetical protein AYK25_05225 [Thermoplasmatales archaeon SM1-50]|nr:MAG: hypothetical protein AYK25_05225 [Thermoplasmatales archaeon SM1-50]